MIEEKFGPSRPLLPPLYASAVYTFADLDALEAVYRGEASGFIYARDGHPNADWLAAELVRLEGGSWAIVTVSGMAAIALTCAATLQAGDLVVASRRLYGRTLQLLKEDLPRWNIRALLVDLDDEPALQQALAQRPKWLLVETLSNPTLRIAHLPRLAQWCRQYDCPLVVDNTFATPSLCRPLQRGATLVVESLTKMIGGHSQVTLGAVIGAEPAWHERFRRTCSIWGWTGNAFDCWLASFGLHTLELRMRQASATAAALADWLAQLPAIARVIYPGRPDHPDHARARELFGQQFGNMLSLELAGGREAVNLFLRRQHVIPLAPSLGDVRTICAHPDSTSHRYASAEEKQRDGITPGLLRVSVGLEPLEVLQYAFLRGLGLA